MNHGKVRLHGGRLMAGFLLVALIGTACSSSKKSSTTSAASSTTVAPSPTTTTTAAPAVDTSGDAAKAHQINLTSADMPAGWTGSAAAPKTAQDEADDASIAACIGAPAPKDVHTADVDSDDFGNGSMGISSNVTFVRTEADAKKELAAFTSSKLAGCLKPSLEASLARDDPGTTVTNFALTPIAAPPGGDGGFGYRVQATLAGQGQQVPIVVDILAVMVGRAELQVTGEGIAGQAPSEQLLRDLMAKMVARAK